MRRKKGASGKFIPTGKAMCHPRRQVHGRNLCDSCYQAWYSKNTEKGLKNSKNRYSKRLRTGAASKFNWKYRLKRRFGLTELEFLSVLEVQNSRCAICFSKSKTNRKLSVDPDHSTGKVRGLLCDTCNRGLGFFQDNVSLLLSAIKYLKNHNSKANNDRFLPYKQKSIDKAMVAVMDQIDSFRKNYFEIKEKLGLKTQKDVSARTGINVRQISKIEGGQKPRYSTIKKLADGFGVPVSNLI